MNYEDEPIIKLIEKNNIKGVEKILQEGYDASKNESYAICPASLLGRFEILKLILDNKNVDPSSNSNYAIKTAFSFGYSNIIELLWSDNRVQQSLMYDSKKLYNCLLIKKTQNKIKEF